MINNNRWATVALLLAAMGFTSVSNAALVSRLGGLAYYDTEADLTWLADANAAGTTMNWADANAWAAGLDVAGVTGWRLPDTIDVGNDGATYTNITQGVDFGYNITTHSELSNMFYNVLGNTAYYNTSAVATGCTGYPDYCLSNTGPFSNLKPVNYWSATEYAPGTTSAWDFNMSNGYQLNVHKSINLYAWAVQSGDAGLGWSPPPPPPSAVPVPAAVWLFGSGLIGLVGLARHKR